MSKSTGIYIHIPFCRSKCCYCDFNSYPGKEALAEQYFEALKTEIHRRSESMNGRTIDSVFIGGGTPSYVDPEYIRGIMDTCTAYMNVRRDAEISIESNPGTLTREKLDTYINCGINRLSIGLQAWQDGLLKKLGRIHGRKEFVENLQLAVEAGFKNINADLIFGIPGQKTEEWSETVKNVVKLGLAHISCYSMKIEEGTVFGSMVRDGVLEPADDEIDRQMYHFTVAELQRSGYKHYEISNFAKPGYECRHNLIYWRAEEYLGAGAGAHSYINGVRFNNIYGINEYINAVLNNCDMHENREKIGMAESMSEFMILGLRLTDGVKKDEFEARYGSSMYSVFGNQIAGLLKKKLLEETKGGVKLTPLGLDLANSVFVNFL